MTEDELSPAELKLWREREMTFPPHVRRMKPDALDYALGTVAALRTVPLPAPPQDSTTD
jgi:hypothetical protein